MALKTTYYGTSKYYLGGTDTSVFNDLATSMIKN